MSDIERYVPVIRMAPEGSNAATMREYNSGKYVLYSDHEKRIKDMEAQSQFDADCIKQAAAINKRLREALERIIGSVGDNGPEARNRARQALETDK